MIRCSGVRLARPNAAVTVEIEGMSRWQLGGMGGVILPVADSVFALPPSSVSTDRKFPVTGRHQYRLATLQRERYVFLSRASLGGEMAQVSVVAVSENDADQQEVLFTNEDRITAELVIGLVGPVGAGVTTTASAVQKVLSEQYGYSVDVIKVSSIINDKASLVEEAPIDQADGERIAKLQKVGSALRAKFGEAVLAEFVVQAIHSSRSDDQTKLVRRHCTIIDSLKNPAEADRLRLVYGNLFWLVGVFAPEDVRISRLTSASPNNAYVHLISDQDYDEGTEYGQSVKDTMTLADVFIRNDEQNTIRLDKEVSSFLDRLFQIGVSTPNSHESAMFSAANVAARSACLSRQVGAVIQNADGEIVGSGANDVPRFGGGLYSSDLDLSLDHRCYNWGGKICHNDSEKNSIFSQIMSIASDAFPGATAEQKAEFMGKIKKGSRLKGLIEFSRSVHAEMAAIVSVARDGHGSVQGATLYTTTFPCHNCARHIVAAGIRTVFYIEPYPKSLALKLHNDAIGTSEGDAGKKVLFLQYQGVAPRSFARLFPQNPVRKAGGHALFKPRTDAKPLAAPSVDSLVTREELEVVQLLKEVESVQASA